MPPRIFLGYPDEKVVEDVEKKLTEKGFETIATSNANEVIRTINVNNVPHMIVLHTGLEREDVNCLNVCKELKQEKRTWNIPIVLLKHKADLDIKPFQQLKINQIIDIPSGIDAMAQKITLLYQSIQQRKRATQAKSKMTPAKIAGIVVILFCVFVMIFLVFIPLFSGSK